MSNLVSTSNNYFKLKINHIIYLTGFLTFLTQLPNFYGEDIVNARNNYLYGEKTDFWGGISTLVYGYVPNLFFRWQIWLAIFQIAIAAYGLAKLLSVKVVKKPQAIALMLIIYSCLLFAASMTRDGLMFSLLLLGLAILKVNIIKDKPISKLLIPLSIISLAMSFRPWLSIAILPVVALIFYDRNEKFGKKLTAILLLMLALAPGAIEISSSKLLHLQKSFPEQQVMIMDAAASYCYSNNVSTNSRANSLLNYFSTDKQFGDYACNIFRADTWLSLTRENNLSDSTGSFWIIPAGDLANYQTIKRSWIKLITLDPITYFQNKILFAGKIIVGSDSRNLAILNANGIQEEIAAIYKLPFDLFITLHAFSVIAVFSYICIFLLCKKRSLRSNLIQIDRSLASVSFSIFLWVSLSAIAYIGSNGRYVYSITLMTLVLLMSKNQQVDLDDYAQK